VTKSCVRLWRLAVAGATHGVGLVLGGSLAAALRLEPPHIPEQADPTLALLLLLPGGMAIALGLAAMASGLEGRPWQRWAILGSFAFVVNGGCRHVHRGGGRARLRTLICDRFASFPS
jgi:hypothetical protein